MSEIAKESEIVKLLASEWSWEQVLYKIIGLEGLDPWDVDLAKLSSAFLKYLMRLKMIDFKIPAKYVIIAAILLRMKSDGLRLWPENGDVVEAELEAVEPRPRFDIPALQIPTERLPKRGIVADDLIAALRLALASYERKNSRLARAAAAIHIEQTDITERIAALYKRIEMLLKEIRAEEIEFSKLLKEWNRSSIVDAFLPMLHLEHERKISCRQSRLFDEIYIRMNGHAKR